MTVTAPTPRDLLVEARTLIARPEAWTQGAAARDAGGEPVGAELKAAALTHRDLFDEAAASSGESDESEPFDCHCTD